MALVPVAGVFADGLGPVPSNRVDIGTVGNDRVLNGGCVYEVTTNSSFTGANDGESGLRVKAGETAYIYIKNGVTLTCTGKAGANATTQVGAGAMPSSKKPDGISEHTEDGVTWREIEFVPASAGGGGQGGQGGGAGIEVPANSGLVVYGDGNLTARGGKGGNAAVGGAGAQGAYYIFTWFVYDQEDNKLCTGWDTRLVKSDEEAITKEPGPVSGEEPTEPTRNTGAFAQPATGGGGGGGAGGGGAAIGSRGADGGSGGSGGAVSGTTPDPLVQCLLAVAGSKGAAASSVGACGSVWIGLSSSGSSKLTPGEGGESTGSPVKIDRDWVAFNAYDEQGDLKDPVRILFENGQPGGQGGAGGKGAEIGTGGTGGQGGQGGFGGGVTSYVEKETVTNKDWVVSVPGDQGTTGSEGGKREPGKIPVLVRDSEGKNVTCFGSLSNAVDSIVANPTAYGSTITVIGSVTGEKAQVPSGTKVVVEKDAYFCAPRTGDLRQPYYLYPVPCDTNGDSRTYHFTFDANKVVPGVSTFGVTNKIASLTVTNVCKEMYYRPFSSATLRDFKPEPGSKKMKADREGPLTFTAGAAESKRFYRVGVTDDPRE